MPRERRASLAKAALLVLSVQALVLGCGVRAAVSDGSVECPAGCDGAALGENLGTGTASPEPKSRPHIVLAVVDDLGWADVGWRRGRPRAMPSRIHTPRLEALLAEGIRLDRHYAYNWCGPSRASLLSGRLPIHVQVNSTDPLVINPQDPISGATGIPTKMTLIPAKLKTAGYATHFVGKWGVGFATREHLPRARGFDSFLGYFNNGNDYWDQTLNTKSIKITKACEALGVVGLVDFWENDGPARTLNATGWEDFILTERSVELIDHHDPSQPLFLVHSFHSVHTPLHPAAELEVQYGFIPDPTRRAYASMVSYVDSAIGEIVDALRAKDMWSNTLLVVTSDNGGPIYPGKSLQLFGGADNWPLRGAKTSDWEGGIRVNALVSGGVLPQAVRGTVQDRYVHIADWYATFCELAQVDVEDATARQFGLPPVDSMSQWPLLSGQVSAPIRKEIHISPNTLIQGRWKLITGNDQAIKKTGTRDLVPLDVHRAGYGEKGAKNWSAPWRNCSDGCLFDIRSDPREMHEMSDVAAAKLRSMLARLEELNKGSFVPDRGQVYALACGDLLQTGYYGPFWPPGSAASTLRSSPV